MESCKGVWASSEIKTQLLIAIPQKSTEFSDEKILNTEESISDSEDSIENKKFQLHFVY